MREKLIALSWLKKGNWKDMYEVLKSDSQLKCIDEAFAHRCADRFGDGVLTWMDDAFPECWREMPKPPFVVFYQGDLKRLQSFVVSIVGGKELSPYTDDTLQKTIQALPPNVCLLSGFERGVEATGMAYGTSLMGILAAGLNSIAPYAKYAAFKRMDKSSLLLTELPPEVPLNQAAYNRSYHLMHELSQLICVFDLPTFDTRKRYLSYLVELGKEVVVAPNRPFLNTAGGLELVNAGAHLLLNPKTLFQSSAPTNRL